MVNEANEKWARLEGDIWERLSPAQRAWLAAFVASANALTAVRVAYRPATEVNVRAIASQVQHNPTVQAALDVVGADRDAEPISREQLIASVRRAIRKAEPGSVSHQRLLAQLERLTQLEPVELAEPKTQEPADQDLVEVSVPPKHKFTVGQIVTQRDAEGVVHRGRVIAVDENGRPLKVETLS